MDAEEKKLALQLFPRLGRMEPKVFQAELDKIMEAHDIIVRDLWVTQAVTQMHEAKNEAAAEPVIPPSVWRRLDRSVVIDELCRIASDRAKELQTSLKAPIYQEVLTEPLIQDALTYFRYQQEKNFAQPKINGYSRFDDGF